MYFYKLKHKLEVGWVSLKNAQHGPLFTIYTSSFNNFKHKFSNWNAHHEIPKKTTFLLCWPYISTSLIL